MTGWDGEPIAQIDPEVAERFIAEAFARAVPRVCVCVRCRPRYVPGPLGGRLVAENAVLELRHPHEFIEAVDAFVDDARPLG